MKVVELKKLKKVKLQKGIFCLLSRYHHATVMLYTWYTYEDSDPCHRWFIVMNYFVHSIMYTYYGLRVMIVYKIFLHCRDNFVKWEAVFSSLIQLFGFFQAMGFKLTKSVSMIITSLQILQMVAGAIFNLYGFFILCKTKRICPQLFVGHKMVENSFIMEDEANDPFLYICFSPLFFQLKACRAPENCTTSKWP